MEIKNDPNKSEEYFRPVSNGNNWGDNNGKNRKTFFIEKWWKELSMTTQKSHIQVKKGIYSGGIKQARILLKLTKNWGKLMLRETPCKK